MVVLSIRNFRRQMKLCLKIILLFFIVCYLLPKLFMIFLSFDAPRNIPVPEKPMRVMSDTPPKFAPQNNFQIEYL